MTPIPRRAGRLRDRYPPDLRRPVQAFASAAGAAPGESLEFRVSVPSRAACLVTVRRFGTEVPTPAVKFAGEDQGGAALDRSGSGGGGSGGGGGGVGLPQGAGAGTGSAPLVWCDWAPSLLLDIPDSWPPGLYAARFSVTGPKLSLDALRGRSAYVPFVVRAPWNSSAPTLVVVPFATYAARNRWPLDGVTGRSLEAGYAADGRSSFTHRASAVSFDRPFSGKGLPEGFGADAALAERLSAEGRAADFAADVDIHAGLVDPARYAKVLCSPHADYWSPETLAALRNAAALGADVQWPAAGPDLTPTVRYDSSPDGRPHRVLRMLGAQ